MKTPQTVYVVDDDASVRKALRLILEAAQHHVKIFESATLFLEQWDACQPGCLVLDVRMPGMDGMELLRRLADQRARIPILMLSAHGDIPMAVKAVKSGAIDVLEKPIDADILRRKVAEALIRDAEWRLDQDERNEIEQLLSTLTEREREVLGLLVQGKHAKTIANVLGTSHNTVRVQRASVMQKLRADTVGDLMRMMHKVGLLDGNS